MVIDGEEEFEVEEVIRHRMFRRRREYLIKWKGYPSLNNTWEPVSNFGNAMDAVNEYKRVVGISAISGACMGTHPLFAGSNIGGTSPMSNVHLIYPTAALHPTSSDADSDVTSVRDASFPTGLHPLPTRTRRVGLNAITGVQPPRASAEPEPQPEPVRMASPAGDPLAAEEMIQSPPRSEATWEDDPMAVEVAAGGMQMVSATPQPAATIEGAGEGVGVTGVPATSAHPLLPIRAASPATEQPVAAPVMEMEVLRAESPEAAPISPSPVEGPTVEMQEQAQAEEQPQTLVPPATVEPMQQTVVVQVQPAAVEQEPQTVEVQVQPSAVVQEQPAAVVQVQPIVVPQLQPAAATPEQPASEEQEQPASEVQVPRLEGPYAASPKTRMRSYKETAKAAKKVKLTEQQKVDAGAVCCKIGTWCDRSIRTLFCSGSRG